MKALIAAVAASTLVLVSPVSLAAGNDKQPQHKVFSLDEAIKSFVMEPQAKNPASLNVMTLDEAIKAQTAVSSKVDIKTEDEPKAQPKATATKNATIEKQAKPQATAKVETPEPTVKDRIAMLDQLPPQKQKLVKDALKVMQEDKVAKLKKIAKIRDDIKKVYAAKKFDNMAYLGKVNQLKLIHDQMHALRTRTMVTLAVKLTPKEREIVMEMLTPQS